MRYLFGDTDLAARRLGVLGEVFEPTTRAFLLDARDRAVDAGRQTADQPRLALDIGCGPGHTTRLLSEVLRAERTVGLDNSEPFIALARRGETDGISFRIHDVTSVPLPEAPADVIFCRFLMTHMQDPKALIGEWATQLRPGGLLLMEEVEDIQIDNPVFAAYIGIVEAMLADQSNELYIGRVLDGFPDTNDLKKRSSKVRSLRVTNQAAATMFSMNIQTWKHQPFIKANHSADEIEDLEQNLLDLSQDTTGAAEIEWRLRQIAFTGA